MWEVTDTPQRDIVEVVLQDDTEPTLTTITDPDAWEAIEVTTVAPMHSAFLERIAQRGDNFWGNKVDLKDSTYYESRKIGLKKLTPPRTLLQVHILNGFYNLPSSFIKMVCDYKDIHPKSSTLTDQLVALGDVLPLIHAGLDTTRNILDNRRANMEVDEDLEKVIALEEVLDCFDKDDRSTLEREVKAAKETRDTYKEFSDDATQWKAWR